MPSTKAVVKNVGEITIHRRRGLKNLSLRVSRDGSVRLSLPWYVPRTVGLAFVSSKRDWLKSQRSELPKALTPVEKRQLAKAARSYLQERTDLLAEQHGFKYKKLRFSNASTRWGSCSERGTISLNIQLMRLSNDLIDYVIIHELCHLDEMNHSKKFWNLVEGIDPEFKSHRKQLKSSRL